MTQVYDKLDSKDTIFWKGKEYGKEFERKRLIDEFINLISDVYNNPKFDKKRTEDFTQFVMLIESELNKLKDKKE